MNIYDLVIVGSGPSGLALAQMCSKSNKKILIIDREASIGGCHRVRRVSVGNEMLFTEHGPRIYSETYVVFKKLLNEMGVDFYDLYKKYNFGFTQIGGETVFSVLTFYELSVLAAAFFYIIIDNEYGIDIVLYDYIKDFKPESKEMIDRVCKLTDGGGSDKFTLNEFLQLFNQQFFYDIYQPKKPNDISLFVIWKSFLEKKKVDFLLNTDIKHININNRNEIDFMDITVNNKKERIYGKKFVLAVPPENLYDIMQKFEIPNSLNNLQKFSKDTAYIHYISMTFHWDKKINLKNVYGFPKSEWGVAFILLSDYMDFEQSTSKTLMTIGITLSDRISSNNNKTANECTEEELFKEVFHQLKLSFGDSLENPTSIVMSPGVIYSEQEKEWQSLDTAFISSALHTPLPFECGIITNLYNLGTHNGKSLYKFTSLESAVSNSIHLSDILYPGNNNKKIITKSTSITDVLNILIIVIIIYLISMVFILNGK
jgi:protoporphyrinogen oxidase